MWHLRKKNQSDTILKVEENKKEHEELVMYGRRNSVLIFNFNDPYDFHENCVEKALHVFNDIQGLQLTRADIGRAHRLGPLRNDNQNSKIRPIIVKLVRRDVKDMVLNNWEYLNGTRLFIKENVTRHRKELMDSARKIIGNAASVWSYDGRITALFAGRRYQIINNNDIDKLKNCVHEVRQRCNASNTNTNTD